MKNTPLVSIITPSYNQGRYLETTIKSVINQDYPNIEYIVIDGGSTDGSVEIIQSYADSISVWVSEPDQGQADAINKGFQRAHGEILAWLNSDDLYYPGAVEGAVSFLLENRQVGMVYGDADLIDETGQVIGRFAARQTNYQRLMQGRGNIPQQAAFWRAELFQKVGPLDTSLFFAMDFDLWVRFSKVTEIRYHPKLWAGFRLHPQGKTALSFNHCWPEMRLVHKKEGGKMISVFMARFLLRKYFRRPWYWIKGIISKI